MSRHFAGRLIGLIVFVGSLWTSASCSPPQSQPAATTAPDRHVVIISVDGLRPDMALRADMPALRSLMKRGCFTFWAQTIPASITLPSHTSMLTGVSIEKHGVDWNSDRLGPQAYPRVPTLFEVARKAGFTTVIVAGKSKFAALAKPGTLDWSFLPDSSKTTDTAVADQAVALIHRLKPGVLFVHFPDTDSTGHRSGWGSPEQLKAIENADAQIRRVIEAIEQERLTDKTLVIVSADHGGAGRNHGPDDPRSRFIPWIAVGPGVRENFDLTRLDRLTVHTEDTFATACWFLKIPLAADIDGKPVKEIANPAMKN